MRNILAAFLFFSISIHAQVKPQMAFTVSMDSPALKKFHVVLHCNGLKGSRDLKMPAWTTGYYQILDFANNVENFSAEDGKGHQLGWNRKNINTWTVEGNTNSLVISYDVKATRPIVATNYIDDEHAYLSPAGVFMHLSGRINTPVTVTIKPYTGWKNVATGLDSVKGIPYTYTAPDFDILYDAPILIGNLEALPEFKVKGIPHRFIGYKLGEFDRQKLMNELKMIVEQAVDIFGDIPYKHYTFLGTGPGRGGIEHLNSSSLSFTGNELNTPEGHTRMLSFIAHEYFHHYNVKRVRPIELGPFDYDKPNRTNMLWVSEGLSVYYEYLLIRRAGLINDNELFKLFMGNIRAYENQTGHLYQSLLRSSYETWDDGPLVNDPNKTISYYDKGPILGLMMDFAIRHESNNKHSLDDVMRFLYTEYYKKKKRGFTETEFNLTCEKMAGKPLPELFSYVSSVAAPDYPKYFAYGGLTIDTSWKEKPGAWSGINYRYRNDTLRITTTELNSPAWQADLESGDIISYCNQQKATDTLFRHLMGTLQTGDTLHLTTIRTGVVQQKNIILKKKTERVFEITRTSAIGDRESAIYRSWLKQ